MDGVFDEFLFSFFSPGVWIQPCACKAEQGDLCFACACEKSLGPPYGWYRLSPNLTPRLSSL